MVARVDGIRPAVGLRDRRQSSVPRVTGASRSAVAGTLTLALAAMASLAGCTPESQPAREAVRSDTAYAQAELSPEIHGALMTFRARLREPPGLEGGSASSDTLVQRFFAALSAHDTAALRTMLVSRAEFAYFSYPHSAIARPPYELDPETTWFLSQESSDKSVSRALRQWGGRDVRYLTHACPNVQVEGPATVYGNCTARWLIAGSDTASGTPFRALVSMSGQFKFLSYANEL